MTRRISTRTFASRAAARLDNGAKVVEALSLPQLPDILDTLDGPRPMVGFVLGPFQTFKSLAGQLHLARNKLVNPAPCLWYAPSVEFGKEFADLKFNPLFDSQPPLRALLYSAKSKRAKLRYSLAGGASLLILSANTENDRHGKTARDLYLDEVHTYEPGWIAQIRNRHGAYPDDFLELFMSTGLTAHTEGADEWASTDQRTWHMRCPSCQRLILPRFAHYGDPADARRITGGLRYERAFLDNGLPDAARIAATLVHECPHCHATLPDTAESRLALNGTAAAPRGLYVIANPHAAPRRHGWTFHGITVRPWLPIVLRFEKAQLARQRGDLTPLAEWVREECADIWNADDYLQEKTLRRPSGYKLAEVWPEERSDARGRPLRFAGVDVQLDHFVVVIRKVSRLNPSRSRLHWCEKVTTPAHVEQLCATHGVPPERTFLDGRHEPQKVRRLAARYGWRVVQGESEKDYPHTLLDARGRVLGKIRRIYSEPLSIDPFQGLKEQGLTVVKEYRFSKPSALERLHLLRTLDTNDGVPLWTDADDAPSWYAEEVNAFRRVGKRAADGSLFYEWIAGRQDHAADSEVIITVAMSIAGLVGAEAVDVAAPTGAAGTSQPQT